MHKHILLGCSGVGDCGGGGSDGGRIKKKLKGSFAPSSSTLCASFRGSFCCPVHSTHSWQEGTRRPGKKVSTWCLVIWGKNAILAVAFCSYIFFYKWLLAELKLFHEAIVSSARI